MALVLKPGQLEPGFSAVRSILLDEVEIVERDGESIAVQLFKTTRLHFRAADVVADVVGGVEVMEQVSYEIFSVYTDEDACGNGVRASEARGVYSLNCRGNEAAKVFEMYVAHLKSMVALFPGGINIFGLLPKGA